MTTRLLTYLGVLMLATTLVLAESLWTPQAQPLCIDTKAHKVGDLLIVEITQQSRTSTQSTHSTKKDMDVDAGAGAGLFGGFAGMGVKGGRGTSGTGASTSSTQLVDHLTVKITEVMPDGNFKVEGTRCIKLEKDEMLLTLSGIVRPEDIQPDNSVVSILIAEQRLEAKGTGPIAEKQRPGLISRLLSFLW